MALVNTLMGLYGFLSYFYYKTNPIAIYQSDNVLFRGCGGNCTKSQTVSTD